jgi:conjugal transfer mating pair stabilization protein TraG
MEYQIISFGNGEILKGVFDAIAVCLNADSGTLYKPLIRLSLIIGSLWVVLYGIYGDYIKAIIHWIIPMTAIMQLLFVPQATVWIVDPVSRYHQKVDHVPYGLAMIAGYISKIGHEITAQVEKVFVLPDDLKYQKTGTLFASHLLQQAKTFRITNEELAENMRQFVGQCVIYDVLLGSKYSIEDLRHSDDIWGLVSTNASPVRSFIWKDLRGTHATSHRPQIITCKEGVTKFNQQWNGELNKAGSLFGKKVFGKNSYLNPKAELFKHLPLAYQALTDMAKSAEEILKQNMMIYAVVDGIEQKSTSLGNGANFALKRAYLQQRSAYETLGAMAAETLPVMKAVLEAIAYVAFLFVIPLSILPFGYSFLKSWVQTLLWLQMWAPLYAVLNYMMTMAARAKSISALSLSNEAGVTIANSVGLVNVNADIAAMAGYLAMSIPFLCIALVKGVGSFVHLASHLSNITQGAASSAAHDIVTGNHSYGNISQGNRQISNTNMLSHSNAASYRSGSFHQTDGRSDVLTTADGEQIINVSSSNLPISLNVAETQSSQLSEQASKSYQKATGQSKSSSENLASSYRNLVELNEQISKGENINDQISQGKFLEETKAIQKADQKIASFADENNLTKQQAADVLGGISVSAGIAGSRPSSNSGKNDEKHVGLSGDIKASANAQLSGSAADQELQRKAEQVSRSEDFQESMREAAQASKSLSHAMTTEKSKRWAENISGSYEAGITLREEATKSYRESEDFQHRADKTKAFSSAINANYNQEFVSWMSNQHADNTGGILGARGVAHIIANEPNLRTEYANRFMAEKGLLPQTPEGLKSEKEYAKNLKNEYENNTITDKYQANTNYIHDVKNKAASESITFDSKKSQALRSNVLNKETEVEQKMLVKEGELQQKYDEGALAFGVRKDKQVAFQAVSAGIQHVTGVAGLFGRNKNKALENINERTYKRAEKELLGEIYQEHDGENQTKN